MNYLSTRKNAPSLSYSEAVLQSLAPDGGLYVPEKFPKFDFRSHLGSTGLPRLAECCLSPFLEGDPLQSALTEICEEAFNFDIPLKMISPRYEGVRNKGTAVLEVFHGPTSAFKDVGARFLAACLVRTSTDSPRTVLVATSGDTGGAVAAAFFRKPGIEVFVLYPAGKVAPRQEKQLTAWGVNVHAFAVRGDFDDCQRIVKSALADQRWQNQRKFISANSINIGRLLPQMIYYARASLEYYERNGFEPGFIVPTGNLGNAVAALWAKKIGFPIREVVLATNANSAISDYFKSGVWNPRPTVATLANAMDVGNASNMERLLNLYPSLTELKKDVSAVSVSDGAIQEVIQTGLKEENEVWCPHTATAVYVRRQLEKPHFIVVATAHPAKFDTIVEPLIGESVPVPDSLRKILERPSQSIGIDPSLESFSAAVRNL